MPFLSQKEISNIGFGQVGKNVLLSNLAQYYNPSKIFIGDNVRIDDFCILSADKPMKIGNNVHISAYCGLFGRYGIEIKDFSGISPRCSIFSSTDDFSGDYLIGPTVPDKYRNEISGKVILNEHVQIGANSIVLPGVVIGKGTAVGAMSLVKENLESNKIYAGIPVKFIKNRNKKLFDLSKKYLKENK